MEYKGVGRRFLALLIDTILLTVFLIIFAVVVGPRSGSCTASFYIGANTSVDGVDKFYGLCGFPAFAYFLLTFSYFVASEWLLAGTPGKLATGIRVRSLAGGRISLLASLLRNLLRVVDVLPGCIPYLVGAILIWSSDTRQRLGDRVAGTVVVSASSPRLSGENESVS